MALYQTYNQTDSAAILRELEKETSLPVLSPHAIKIQSEALKQDPHFSVLAGLIRKDPTLTGQILKTANSALYKSAAEILTLKDALTRLGQIEMVNIIMAKVHQKNFRSANPMIREFQGRLWSHSVACATGSLYTARHLSLKEIITKAFIAGLLHDMGKLHILAAIESLMDEKAIDASPAPQEIERLQADFHSEAGDALLSKWHLPEQYRIIARDHHNPHLLDPLLVIVKLSNTLCASLEKRKDAAGETQILNSEEARSMGLDESWATGFKEVL